MQIGFDQIKNTTPKVIRHIKGWIIYTIGGSLIFTDFFSAKLGITPLGYAEWCGVIIFVSKAVSKLFGVGEDEAVTNAVDAIKELKQTTKDN